MIKIRSFSSVSGDIYFFYSSISSINQIEPTAHLTERVTDYCDIFVKMKVLIQFLVIGSLASVVLTVGLYGYPCQENSGCDAAGNLQCVDNRCGCQTGFTRNMFDTCWRAYGEPCEWILDCNVHTFLKCNDTTNTCDCQQPGKFFLS